MATARQGPQPDYRALAHDAVRDEAFVRLVLSAPRGSGQWAKITVRPVLIGGQRCHQVSRFDGRKTHVENVEGDALASALDEALSAGFTQIHIQTTAGDTHVRITRKGRVLVSHGRASRPAPDLAHDRAKQYPLPADRPDPLLEALGLQDRAGRVRPTMRGKFLQVNEFLRILDQVVPDDFGRPVEIVDCGSGSAYLTFAAFHWLNHVRGTSARVVGVDANPEMVEKATRLRDALGWTGIEFHTTPIEAFRPARAPDVVLSLHACDTATDDALALGIAHESVAILAAPCCQHELSRAIRAEVFRPVLRHGILRERLADLLTDTFRAQILRVMGYATDVIQFVDPDATAKNLMIRAVRRLAPGDPAAVREYLDLRRYWDVVPYLERRLPDRLRPLLEPALR